MKRFGYGKGALSRAAEEAILKWISTIKNEDLNFDRDPWKPSTGYSQTSMQTLLSFSIKPKNFGHTKC